MSDFEETATSEPEFEPEERLDDTDSQLATSVESEATDDERERTYESLAQVQDDAAVAMEISQDGGFQQVETHVGSDGQTYMVVRQELVDGQYGIQIPDGYTLVQQGSDNGEGTEVHIQYADQVEQLEYTEGQPEYTEEQKDSTAGQQEYTEEQQQYTEEQQDNTEEQAEYTEGQQDNTEEQAEYTEEQQEYTEEQQEYTVGQQEYTQDECNVVQQQYSQERAVVENGGTSEKEGEQGMHEERLDDSEDDEEWLEEGLSEDGSQQDETESSLNILERKQRSGRSEPSPKSISKGHQNSGRNNSTDDLLKLLGDDGATNEPNMHQHTPQKRTDNMDDANTQHTDPKCPEGDTNQDNAALTTIQKLKSFRIKPKTSPIQTKNSIPIQLKSPPIVQSKLSTSLEIKTSTIQTKAPTPKTNKTPTIIQTKTLTTKTNTPIRTHIPIQTKISSPIHIKTPARKTLTPKQTKNLPLVQKKPSPAVQIKTYNAQSKVSTPIQTKTPALVQTKITPIHTKTATPRPPKISTAIQIKTTPVQRTPIPIQNGRKSKIVKSHTHVDYVDMELARKQLQARTMDDKPGSGRSGVGKRTLEDAWEEVTAKKTRTSDVINPSPASHAKTQPQQTLVEKKEGVITPKPDRSQLQTSEDSMDSEIDEESQSDIDDGLFPQENETENPSSDDDDTDDLLESMSSSSDEEPPELELTLDVRGERAGEFLPLLGRDASRLLQIQLDTLIPMLESLSQERLNIKQELRTSSDEARKLRVQLASLDQRLANV